MALPRKVGPAQAVALIGQIPQPPPKVPEEMVKRFPVWAEYQKHLDEWWGKVTDLMQRDRDEIKTQFQTDEADAKSNLAAIQKTMADLAAQLQTLSSSNTGLAALAAQLTALSNAMAVHIAATVAHGTQSDIVGVTDEQALENKSLGLNNPGYGRFTTMMQSDVIPSGQTVEIPVGYTMIVGKKLRVDGRLIIAGSLVVV